MAENKDLQYLKVEEEKKRGKNGEYTVKVVKFNGKSWTVSKKDQENVEVGKSYSFSLEKSEYNDSIYYWANLSKDSKNSSAASSSITNKDVVGFFDSLDKESKLKMITFLIERLAK